ncbi:MAG TPA: formate C-acetyltransferase [Firmicutes bacterium]|nr:formate C-acetyltransferase [Bacillota bacterium]HOQ23927.1 formate C-acetyltransferase [Bacillota bacterium]HPT67179.1 formate C-acetyltransferase [Bacillota bacterium]
MDAWRGFKGVTWRERIDVTDFVRTNYEPYAGDSKFLSGPSERTRRLWQKCQELFAKERAAGGVLAIDTKRVAGITAWPPGYIDKEDELIVGLQTDQPLKRMVNPWGGWRMVEAACKARGVEPDPTMKKIFTRYRRTQNEAIFRIYTPAMRQARHLGIITGLPDAYGRGRLIGDYRRIPLYGANFLIEQKRKDLYALDNVDDTTIHLREDIADQVRALERMIELGLAYGCDISRPAVNAHEAVQWLYLAYLCAIKEQNGAAMSFGHNSPFLDIYIQRDLAEGTLTEEQAQELIDQLVMKLRMVRHLRTPEYDELFAGDPVWVTESLGGLAEDGRPLVTKTDFRWLQTLRNLGPAPEPNLTILWSPRLPEGFRNFCAEVAIETSALQFENDEIMRPIFGDDYGISCCVSATRLGKDMQFFGARVNLAKALLLAINGGRDEISGDQVLEVPELQGEVLEWEQVWANFEKVMTWLSVLYSRTMNCIHYMHDKYNYERVQMALIDSNPNRFMSFGIAGLSVVADSLSAIKYARVKVVRDERGIAKEFQIEGDFPCFGNDDDRVDGLAVRVIRYFYSSLAQQPIYRKAVPTLSILTITSNVVYGKKTGATPDGRPAGKPFAPGANPMHGREKTGVVAAMRSVAKLPYDICRDGISYTFSITPRALGQDEKERVKNLKGLIDGYFDARGHHINVNVYSRETLIDAMEHPELYPNLTIRVSGYAVHFTKLSREQQQEVIERTIYERL